MLIESVEITSDSGVDKDYEAGDEIEITVTFSEAVAVTGTPRLKIKLNGTRMAEYVGSGSTAPDLVFSYTVTDRDYDLDGVSLPNNGLRLNGGTIKSQVDGTDALLDLTAVPGGPAYTWFDPPAWEDISPHRVHNRPALTDVSVASNPAVGSSYSTGETILIDVAFDKPMRVITHEGVPTFEITFEASPSPATWKRREAHYTEVVGGNSVRFAYEVQSDDYAENGLTAFERAIRWNGGLITRNGVHDDITLALRAKDDHTALNRQAVHKVNALDTTMAPVIADAGPFTVSENQTAVATLTATDGDTASADLVWTIEGGADELAFELSTAGVLTFAAAKDYEAPDDADADGAYEVDVMVSDGVNRAVALFVTAALLTVRLADADEVAPTLTSASVDGATLTLTWDEALDSDSAPAPADCAVAVSGAARAVSSVNLNGATVTLTLASPAGHGQAVTLDYTPGTNRIRDRWGNEAVQIAGRSVRNDSPEPSLSIQPVTVDESDGTASFTVMLNVPSAEQVTVDYATADGTATAGSDYTAANGTLTFAAGETSKSIVVTIAGDTVDEDDETFSVTLGNAVNASIGQAVAAGTIVDDDEAASAITDQVTGLTATASVNRVALSWTPPAGTILGYRIEASYDGGTVWAEVEDNTNSTSTAYAHGSGLMAGETRHYRVSAITEDGAGTPSAAAEANATDTVDGLTATGVAIEDTPDGMATINLCWKPTGVAASDLKNFAIRKRHIHPSYPAEWSDQHWSPWSKSTAADCEAGSIGFRVSGSIAPNIRYAYQIRARYGMRWALSNDAEAVSVDAALDLRADVLTGNSSLSGDTDVPATVCPAYDDPATPEADAGSFIVNIGFSTGPAVMLNYEAVTGFVLNNDVTLENATAELIDRPYGAQLGYRVRITATTWGQPVAVSVPAGAVTHPASSVRNQASNVFRRNTSASTDCDTGSDITVYPPAVRRAEILDDDDRSGMWSTGERVRATLEFTEPVTVTTDNGIPTVSLSIDGKTVQASYAEGTGGDTLAFEHVVTAEQSPFNSASLVANSLSLNGGAIASLDGPAATLAHPGAVKQKKPATGPKLTAEVSVSAGTSPVTEGTPAAFTLTRTGDTAAALTVTVSVSEDGAVFSGTPPTEAEFAAGSATLDLAVATEDDEVAGDGSVVTVILVAGTGYAVDADASEATVTVEDDDAVPENAAPTGLPTIAGTAQVGETLTASAADIADADGLANATFAWQWIANDGTADADIAGATGASYTLTAAEAGKTVKVRVVFTDDGGTEETLVSEVTAAVAAALPVVSVGAAASPVTEGAAAVFTLSRTGDMASTLEVSVSVTQAGAVLSGTPASTVTFGAGSAEATLSAATDDDSVAEADGRVTASVVAGSGYGIEANASSAGVDVYDNDEAATTPITAVETLWTSTLTVESIGGVLLGTVGGGNALSPDGWSEDGAQFRVEQLFYFPQYSELAFAVSAAPPGIGQLTLHLDDVQVQLSGAQSERYFYWTVADLGWQAGQAVTVKLTRTDPDAVAAAPGLSVADAQVREAEGAALSFRVTLDEAQASTVSVAVLNDAHDEGSETLTLALSRPFGAELADGTATGTIVNTGPMPQAWITRFGRTVGLQALEAIGDRISGSGAIGGTQVVLGGVELLGSGELAGAMLDGEAGWPARPEDFEGPGIADDGRGMTGRELLLGSSFRLGAGGCPLPISPV